AEADPRPGRVAEDQRREEQNRRERHEWRQDGAEVGEQPARQVVERHEEDDAQQVTEVHGAEEVARLALEEQAADRAGVVHLQRVLKDAALAAARAALPQDPHELRARFHFLPSPHSTSAIRAKAVPAWVM